MSATFKSLDGVAVKGQRVLLRADLNLPMEHGRIADATRLERVAPTIAELADKGAKVIVFSHFGRPAHGADPDLSLQKLVEPLADAIGRPVAFAPACVGASLDQAVAALTPGDVLLVENTRFDAREEANDPSLVQAWARLGDLYVNDAFSAAHRAHASTEGLAKVLPAFAGRAMEAELQALNMALGAPQRPLVAIVGGAKIASKIDLLNNLVTKVDTLVIGGGMANTFLFAQGVAIGASLCERDLAPVARAILTAAERAKCRILLPVDAVVTKEFKAHAEAKTLPIGAVPDDGMILDLGSATLADIALALEGAKTVVWNGPLGAFETPPFDQATMAAARHVAMLTRAKRLVSVAGGGDTVAALNHAGAADAFTYVSTAGGAFLEWLEGKDLPGIAALARAA